MLDSYKKAAICYLQVERLRMKDDTYAEKLFRLEDFETETDLRLITNLRKVNVSNMRKDSNIHGEKRRYPRVILDLPLEYHVLDIPSVHGGIVVNGAEGGFLIHALQDMRLGTRLNVRILFPNEFELATFETLAQIVRKDIREKRLEGYKYGVKVVHINEQDRLKLNYVLSPPGLDQTS